MSSKHKAPLPTNQEPLPTLINQLRGLTESARQQALRAADSIQVRTCWEIGRHIVEFEQQGAERANYGTRLIPRLAESLTAEFGRGFDASNLRYMWLFYLAFPICGALRHELSWAHYRTLLRVEGEALINSSHRRKPVSRPWISLDSAFAGMTAPELISASMEPQRALGVKTRKGFANVL